MNGVFTKFAQVEIECHLCKEKHIFESTIPNSTGFYTMDDIPIQIADDIVKNNSPFNCNKCGIEVSLRIVINEQS